MERIAINKSGKAVLVANKMAAWVDNHDLKAMLKKRSKPAWEALISQPPTPTVKRTVPWMVNRRGNAARMNGRAMTERLKIKNYAKFRENFERDDQSK